MIQKISDTRNPPVSFTRRVTYFLYVTTEHRSQIYMDENGYPPIFFMTENNTNAKLTLRKWGLRNYLVGCCSKWWDKLLLVTSQSGKWSQINQLFTTVSGALLNWPIQYLLWYLAYLLWSFFISIRQSVPDLILRFSTSCNRLEILSYDWNFASLTDLVLI